MTAAGAPGLLALVYAAHEVLLVADLVERQALAAHVVLEHQGNLVGAGLLRDDAAGVVGIDHQRDKAGIVLRRPDVAALARQESAGLLCYDLAELRRRLNPGQQVGRVLALLPAGLCQTTHRPAPI